jgi:hypothetical protein
MVSPILKAEQLDIDSERNAILANLRTGDFNKQSCAFFLSILRVNDRNILSFLCLLFAIVALVSIVEALMRRAMFKLLYEPQ